MAMSRVTRRTVGAFAKSEASSAHLALTRRQRLRSEIASRRSCHEQARASSTNPASLTPAIARWPNSHWRRIASNSAETGPGVHVASTLFAADTIANQIARLNVKAKAAASASANCGSRPRNANVRPAEPRIASGARLDDA